MKCDVYIRKDFVLHVVLSGGTTRFQGIGEHMTNAPTNLAPSTMRPRLLRFGIDCRTFLVYELPDENIINGCAKRFRCAEVLLQPSLTSQYDVDIRKALYANVAMSSGTTMF
uniref:Uncharacterized protein n=1 Tax=Noctiluca scintillans TaxID=2966 RepID=A0A6T8TRP5_NOCSC|mmetsp:Transcript_19192/g.51304  ORF Transcript_19192/g.51304 Transcript_19192/m.51304 type:complete len:112 (+) Transcript_19192:337-672(+)